jgi:hypothetical protein
VYLPLHPLRRGTREDVTVVRVWEGGKREATEDKSALPIFPLLTNAPKGFMIKPISYVC